MAKKPFQNEDDVARIRGAIRTAGLRCTAARIAVMQEMEQAASPVTHAELSENLVPKGFDKTTIYRNLVDLSNAGLLSRNELGDHVWRFEIADHHNPKAASHPHFVCVDCGRVTCLSDVELNSATKKRASNLGRVTEILLKGYCTNCG